MEKILHSLIEFNGELTQDDLQENFLQVVDSRLVFSDSAAKVWNFIKDYYYDEVNIESELPNISVVTDYFEQENDKTTLDYLNNEVAKVKKIYKKSNFKNLLNRTLGQQRDQELNNLLKTASSINQTGVKQQDKILKGNKEAARYLYEGLGKFIADPSGQKLVADVGSSDSVEDFWNEYYNLKHNPHLAYGRISGLTKIDEVCKGLRKGELMLIAGFSGNMKTTLCLNYAYNTAVYFGYNVYYLTLEMSLEQVKRILYTIHSEHPQFKTNPKYRDYYRPIYYNKLRDGELDDEEEAFLKLVLNDLETNPRYGKLIVEKPDTEIRVPDIQAKTERHHRDHGVDLLIVDESRLVSAKRSYGSTTETWNEVLKDLKQLALRFNGGEGLPVISPFQTNRSGYREAENNGGEYKSDCLSYANEAERSSDVIVYTYIDPNLREAQELQIGNLKNRDNDLFKPFRAKVIGWARKLENLQEEFDD